MELEQVWLVGCSRCANSGISYMTNSYFAAAEFRRRGWTDNGRTYCPDCNNETGGSK